MSEERKSRRDFSMLTATAVGGFLAGCTAGTTNGPVVSAEEAKPADGAKPEEKAAEVKLKVDPAQLLKEPHVCRGLNQCKTADNACAGTAAKASVSHECQSHNACAGQGGCGVYPGQNTCKGEGHCAVPMDDETWKLAREQFEQLMQDAGRKFGKAPEKKA